jgi:PTH1 family peptidyl-tRNA hydrolase
VKLVVGLGNPGRRYRSTRHNVGFRVAERFARRAGIAIETERFGGRFGRGRLPQGGEGLDVGILEPLTYMNLSGDAVAEALRMLPVEEPSRDLLVIFDDVDLPFGRLRLRPKGGAAGHKGLAHIAERLGTNAIPRLRFGVGRPEGAMETRDWVLRPFSDEEESRLDERLDEAAAAVEMALAQGITVAMNRFNPEPLSTDG